MKRILSFVLVLPLILISFAGDGKTQSHEHHEGGEGNTRHFDHVDYADARARAWAEEAVRWAEANEAAILALGFIAVAPERMNLEDAKAYCTAQGGRLPLINNLPSLSWSDLDSIKFVEGFGVSGAPWPEALPGNVRYWAGTAYTGSTDLGWIIDDLKGGGVVHA